MDARRKKKKEDKNLYFKIELNKNERSDKNRKK
jgi:hypothetical protein